ncbi:hypothetical protein ACQPX6_06950 [Actinomycetospora sp. CA-101289]|uniref:hypothetical protein n=1 Tax=Actinomycetospora sp. CA-101289 TaxID=3239893 RepID=UPI003D990CCE
MAGRMAEQLRELAEQLDASGWAAELLDHRWQLVWMSTEPNGPYLLHGAGADAEQFAEDLDAESAMLLRACDPRPAPPAWASTVDFARDEFFGRFSYLTQRVHADTGELLGYLVVYTLDVPASTAALLLRGDRATHERMAMLVHPGQRSSAVLFADLEASGSLSRQLPSSVYFRLVQEMRTAMEAAVSAGGGIVGKHAGDGISALFLPSSCTRTPARPAWRWRRRVACPVLSARSPAG